MTPLTAALPLFVATLGLWSGTAGTPEREPLLRASAAATSLGSLLVMPGFDLTAAGVVAPSYAPLTLQFSAPRYRPREPLPVVITGTPGSRVILLVDFDPGPSTLPIVGQVQVGQGPYFTVLDAGAIPSSGELEFACVAPCLPRRLSTIYGQAIALDPLTLQICKSNGASFGVDDLLGECNALPCVAPSANGSNFNGTEIQPGSTVWFNAVVKLSGARPDCPVGFRNVRASFSVGGVAREVVFPNSVITLSSTATAASTTYDEALGEWHTVVPADYSGNIFLSGAAMPVTEILRSLNPVTWSGEFVSECGSTSFQWKWAAAVYTQFTTDLNQVGVKPIDGSANNPYANSHHAGTPENFLSFVTGGARGGGGSNFTGSYSGTETVRCP